jgi:hypothetical protein
MVAPLPVATNQPPQPRPPIPQKPIAKSDPTPVAKPKPRKIPRPKVATAKRGIPEPDKIITMAAEAIRAGQSPRAVEYQLIKEGMSHSDAMRMADFLSAYYQEQLEEQKSKTAVMWVRILGGLPLTVICSLASYLVRGKNSPGMQILAAAFAVIGLFLLMSGLWRFAAGPRPVRLKDMIAAWRNAKE